MSVRGGFVGGQSSQREATATCLRGYPLVHFLQDHQISLQYVVYCDVIEKVMNEELRYCMSSFYCV